MSGQSATLEDLIAQFKLKGGGTVHRGLPPAERQIAMPQKAGKKGEYGKY
jgi:hypothetical protein